MKVVGMLENLMRSHHENWVKKSNSIFNRRKSASSSSCGSDGSPHSPMSIPLLSSLANSVLSRCSKYPLSLSQRMSSILFCMMFFIFKTMFKEEEFSNQRITLHMGNVVRVLHLHQAYLAG